MNRSITFLLLTATCLLLSAKGFGQTKRQDKAQAYYDTLMAQKKRQDAAAVIRRQREANKNNEAVFGDNDPIFKTTTIPSKWNNQSAVILASKTTYNYYVKGTDAYVDEVERRRIKILDKSAVDDLSTFYFIPTNDEGFSLTKKDGTTTNIDLNNAVPVDEYRLVPSSYLVEGNKNYMYSKSYKKIAINMEPGDIIDYYYRYTSSAFKEEVPVVPFPSVAFTLTGDYPVMAQKIKIKAENGFYINCASYNGASEFSRIEDTSTVLSTFLLADSNRDKRKDEMWEDPFRCEPTVKFQVVYASAKDRGTVPYFLGTTLLPVSSVSFDQLKRVANEIALTTSDVTKDYASDITKYMRLHHWDVKDPGLYMKYAYSYFRYFLTLGEMDNEDQSGFTDDMDDNLTNKPLINSEVFVTTLGLVCRDRKIDYDLLFGVPRNMGTLDNLTYPAELKWVIRIKGSPDTYLYPFDAYKDPGDADLGMEGIDMYAIVPDKKIEKVEMNKTATPISSSIDNAYTEKTAVVINANMQGGAGMERNVTITGLRKEPYYPAVIAEGSLLNRELKRYQGKSFSEYLSKIHNDKKKKEEERKITLALADEQKERLDIMKTYFSKDYDIDSYDNFNLLSDGRQVDSTALIFTDAFKLKDIVHKVGQNYIVDAGKFIGKRLELKPDELTRTDNIYFGYADELDDEISITIPAGYTAQGIDALNVSVTNATGGFVSTATLNGNTLVLKVKEYNPHNYETKDSWPDIVKYIQAAYDFTQKKILLKKA